MLFLNSFSLPSDNSEATFCMCQHDNSYSSMYPFGLFRRRKPSSFDFSPITVLYGDNGSGKTTLLNCIADALGVKRTSRYNKSPFFGDYAKMCEYELCSKELPASSAIITSDDVFDYILNVRSVNLGVKLDREELFEEYKQKRRFAGEDEQRLHGLDDYDRFSEIHAANTKKRSGFVRERLCGEIREQSNGESAMEYFTKAIDGNALYLLDEPENSLSVSMQLKLKSFLEDSARFFGCQFIISTHSPFILSMADAVVYDLDSVPIVQSDWTKLKNIRATFDFFMEHRDEFG